MLKLSGITKNYIIGADTKVEALKGISLTFRKNEFVSVLGPSGCGKTTLLNIIGGLDKYTSGDLFIGGRSTREFKDKDWDIYRNHRVGFIFQNYNLIPHQTVLGNVELALTIAGMGKAERTEKAKQALDKVGLSDQYDKYPNQLSGGQGQRVAIARALVNDPDILLADEPTGALDTTTSVQIMELVKEIANERLVIMVTHNSDLAEKYSTRIIKLLDGNLQDDTSPFEGKIENDELSKNDSENKENNVKKEKAKMSFLTAFKLSLQNLLTKKARTTMIGIAGSIGIIGVSLVLSISFGVQTFIENMQNDMLSGNPVVIRESGVDLVSLMRTARRTDQATALREYGYVNVDLMIEYLASRASTADNIMLNNNITQDYIDFILTLPDEYVASMFLDYGLDITNNVFTDFKETANSETENISLSALRTIYTSVLEYSPYSAYSNFVTNFTDIFEQAPDNEDYILSQYDLAYGKPASEKNEIMLVLERDSMLTDLLLAQLGYFTQEEFLNLVFKAAPEPDGSPNPYYDPSLDKLKFSYDELIGRSFTWYSNDDLFIPTENPYAPFIYNAYYNDTFSEGLELTVVGILEPKTHISYGSLQSGIYYTKALTRHIIDSNIDSIIVNSLIKSERDTIPSGVQTVTLPDGTISSGPVGITFTYSFTFLDERHENVMGFLGTSSGVMSLVGSVVSSNPQLEELGRMKTLTLNQLGGVDRANHISIFPVNFGQKSLIQEHLDRWNSDDDIVFYSASQQKEITLTAKERDVVRYTDPLSLVIRVINNLIDIVTFALIGFTSLSLVVSCVMIGIITYVSVVERIKEIGVIRSLGGRKRDVSNLFTAETVIIGLFSGLIGIAATFFGSWIINLIIYAQQGIETIAIFPWSYAVMMVGVSILLTLVSGFMPSRSAARKDPAVALRTE